MRIGLGSDIHKLVPARLFILGGVTIPFDKGPLSHSDGDCLFHAITDALLGAAGAGDIGQHFSDSDPRWKDAVSSLFLKEARRLIRKKGFEIENIDATIHLERPKLNSFLPQMIQNISEQLGISPDRINLKAKSGEGLDSVGRGESISADAVVLLRPAS
jgi:2-C-methyl-D-erythritol 2,4-cyclodiphosphate synthase